MTKDLVWRDPGGPWARFRPFSDYKWIHPSRDCSWHKHTVMWRLCEAVRFSYGEPPRTPPLEGTSLHRRNNSVERPWGILSLFTTCFHHVWILSRVCRWHRHIYVYGVFMKQVVFLTVNHRGPLPLRELHSTDESIVWRDPGGFELVYDYERIHISRVCRWHRLIYVCGVFVKQVVFLTVNHRGPLPLRELHSTDETIVWRDPGGSWACLRPVPTTCEFFPESVT